MSADARVSVVVLTHNRADELVRTLQHLEQLPEQPPVIVVDNASQPGTVEQTSRAFPRAKFVSCHMNLGAAARNVGVAIVQTPYVAFCDDDTWWAPGALSRAADVLDANPTVAVLCARVLVGPARRLDPTCEAMACSPLDSTGLPGPALISFMAGAAVMRTKAYREVGGYELRFMLGAEEWLMALDFAVRGWRIVYVSDVVTHHHPSASRNLRARRIMLARNKVWIAWMRFPMASALRESLRELSDARRLGILGSTLHQTLLGLPWALCHRSVLPAGVHDMVCRVRDSSNLR